MNPLAALCNWLSRVTIVAAGVSLAGLGVIVTFGVVTRYVFNAEPAYVEQLALLLVICVAMFGASVGVHGAGHIGLDSAVKLLPPRGQWVCGLLGHVMVIGFAVVLVYGSLEMIDATRGNDIPTLALSEAWRYAPPLLSGLLVTLFSVERIARSLSAATAAD